MRDLNTRIMGCAASYLGVHERKDAKMMTPKLGIDPSKIAWCAAFVNYILLEVGVKGTNSNLARSFLKFGVKTVDPKPGDIVVFRRGNSSWQGHVGFYYDETGDGIVVLGGNQQDEVNLSLYPRSSLLGFRTYE